jgi:hypothetical protein
MLAGSGNAEMWVGVARSLNSKHGGIIYIYMYDGQFFI